MQTAVTESRSVVAWGWGRKGMKKGRKEELQRDMGKFSGE